MHVHTTASDGSWSPASMVEAAAVEGLSGVGVTDHDTMEGNAEAVECGKRLGVVVIPGVEISTVESDYEIHILGYLIDEGNPSFDEFLLANRIGRTSRIESMVDRLADAGYDVDYADVIAASGGKGSVGRPHLADVLVAKGYASSRNDAFDKYLAPGCPGYIPRRKVSPDEAVSAICKAGGVPILAHPGLDIPDMGSGEMLVDRLMGCGLGGIEVYHPSHSSDVESCYLHLAQKKGLVITGGSDSHGPQAKEGFDLGSRFIEEPFFQALMHIRVERNGIHPAVALFS